MIFLAGEKQMVRSALPSFSLRGKNLLPVVQGGMGVGVSAHRLAGAVAASGAMGTIASIDLRHHHPDLLERSSTRDKAVLDEINLEALDREIRSALAISEGRGAIAVNVMKAVTEHAALVRQACESGAHAIVMGAGLPFDLPDLASGYDVALIPILSDSRGVNLVLKKWMRKNRLPDAIVIEHPKYAGGHLGAPKPEEIGDERFDFPRVIAEVKEVFRELGIDEIPIIPAGGIDTHEKIRELLDLGASAVQIGTPFAVTVEGDAHPVFKKVLAEAKPEDIVTFMSVAGLPARAVITPWLKNYLQREPKLKDCANPSKCTSGLGCLLHCGLRDGNSRAGQFCIDAQLAAALKGDLKKGLFFRGAGKLPFGSAIRPVSELLEFLLSGQPA